MKKILGFLLTIMLLTIPAFAQKAKAKATLGSHSVTLTWTASPDSTPAMTYSVFRGTTPGGESSTALATGVATGCSGATCTYADTTATAAGTTYYYKLTAVLNGASSPQSNEASATIPLAPPSGLTGTGN